VRAVRSSSLRSTRRCRTPSARGEIATDLIDIAIEVDEALETTEQHGSDGRKDQIGEYIAHLVPDGATLQLGIGADPRRDPRAARGAPRLADLVGDDQRRRFSLWSGPGHLIRSTRSPQSFIGGSAELYKWADCNPRLRMFRTETTNDPAMIALNPMMISINAAVQIDLFAQANASYVGGRIFSGFGGQTDFIVGALHSSGGQAGDWFAVVAREVEDLHSGPAPGHAGDLVPAFGRRHRSRLRPHLRTLSARPSTPASSRRPLIRGHATSFGRLLSDSASPTTGARASLLTLSSSSPRAGAQDWRPTSS